MALTCNGSNYMKKKLALSFTLIIVLIVCVFTICFYRSTLINIKSDKSINSHLAANEDNPITVLAMKEYNDYVGILYTDSFNKDNSGYSFRYLKKCSFGKNLYYNEGGNLNSSINGLNYFEIYNDEYDLCTLFIFGLESDYNKCSVFSIDTDPIMKLEEINIDDSPFIIAKNYDITSESNCITVFDGSLSTEDVEQMAAGFASDD